jgi:hypothetical protein
MKNLSQHVLSLESKYQMEPKPMDFSKNFHKLIKLNQKHALVFSTNHFSH